MAQPIAAQDASHTADAHAPQGFIWRYIFSYDHKVIGIQYYFTALFMGLVAGLLAMLVRLNLAWPGEQWSFLSGIFPGGFISPEGYIALFTMHGTLMVFFFLSLAPVSGFGNFLIPLQIGARDMAFPFLNMLSYWTIVPGCLIMLSSFFVKGGAAASGWTAYPPLSAVEEAIPGSGLGQTLWIIGMVFFIASFTMGGLNFTTTILNLRAKGMSMMRLPLTIWALFLVSILGLLAFPALTAGAIMLLFDRHLGTSFFLPTGLYVGDTLLSNVGGTPLLWQHLFWFMGHPEVYILMLPAMGFTSDIIANFSRKPIFSYRIMVLAMMAIGVLSFMVWGHHMFVSGMSPYLGMAFSVSTIIIAIPSAIKVFNWLATLWGARIRLATPMLFALGILSLFIVGGLSGIFLASPATDIPLHDTYFVVAHFHFIMAGASLFGLFAATYYWFPKMFGRMMNETLGRAHFWLTFIAYYTTFFPMHFLGMGGMVRRIYDPTVYEYLQPMQSVNIFMTMSAFVLGASQLIFVVNLFWSLARGKRATENPWEANTLEWTTASPPPHGNWGDRDPSVHRWPYDYSFRGRDFVPQTISPSELQSLSASTEPSS